MPFGVGSAWFSAVTWPLSVAMGKRSSPQGKQPKSGLETANSPAPLQIAAAGGELQTDAVPHADERVLAALLTHFEKPGMSPPSARIRAVVLAEQRQAERSLVGSRAMRLGAVLASKGVYQSRILGFFPLSGGSCWGWLECTIGCARRGHGIR